MIGEIPLLHYNPTTQNQRVRSFGSADKNEDTPYIYRVEDYIFPTSLEPLIRAAYYQVFSEHETLKFNRQKSLESQLQNRVITVKDFIWGLAKSERFYELVVSTNNNYRLVEVCLKRLLGRAPYNQEEKIAWSINAATHKQELQNSDNKDNKRGLKFYYASLHDILSYPCEVRLATPPLPLKKSH